MAAASGKNERDSGDVFRSFQRDASYAHGDKVYEWIVATADHKCAASDEHDKKLFIDFDMAILAAESSRYATYATDVRRE